MMQKLWNSFLFTIGVFAFYGAFAAIMTATFVYGGIGAYFVMVFAITWFVAYVMC